jgi:predicted DNA-binding transcriptional regulator YafY
MPRYQRVDDIIQLAQALRAPGPGMRLEDVQRRFRVGRRTAERMREAIERLYPGMTSSKGPDGYKYWRLRAGEASDLVAWHPDEIEALDEAVAVAARSGNDERSRALGSLRDKLRGLAAPPEPCDAASLGARDELRERLLRAIVLEHEIRLGVRRGEGETVSSRVHPHGILGGACAQLVAFHPECGRALLHPLETIGEVELLETRFERRPCVDLRRFAANAFAPYEEGPVEIAWRFTGEAAREALSYPFHPEQRLGRRPDGAVEVRFRAEGLVTVAWHLFVWGDRAQGVEPLVLKHRFDAMVRRALAETAAPRPALLGAPEAMLED